MIILHNKDFTTKYGTINSIIEAFVEEERNGLFELSFVMLNTDSLFKYIEEDNIVVTNANNTLVNQKFRIYMTRKLMNNRVEVFARHISFDLMYDYIDNISFENQSCEYGLNQLFRNSQFSRHYKGYSDIINAQNYNMSMANVLESIGGKKGSLLDTFGTGAELLRDNENIHILNKRGHDNSVSIEYKKNLTGFELEEDTTELVTRILPYAKYTPTDDEGNSLEEVTVKGGFIDSPLIANYSHPFVKAIDYTDKFEEDEEVTTSKLIVLAQNEYKNNKIDIPKQNFKIEFIPLSKCVGYEGLQDNISLCDTVTIKDTRYNINTQAKVIKTTFNVLKNRYESMELGEPKTSLGDIIGNNDSTKGEKGDKGDKGDKGEDGSIGDFPNSLPSTPIVTTKVYGFANIEISWTFEDKVYYQYEVYASKQANFTPNTLNLVHKGQTSTYMYQAKPNETWYFKVCAVNTHNARTGFGSAYATTVKIDDLSNYVDKMAIGDALIGTLSLDRGWIGELKGNYIDAKQLSVTDGNGKRTLDIDSFGNVNLDVASLKISSSNVATEKYAKTQASNAQSNAISSANASTDSKLKNYYTSTETNTKIKVLNESISLKASKTELTEQIDNLELGTRNYIVGSDFSKDNSLNNWASWYHTTLNLSTYDYGSDLDVDSFIVGKKELRARTDIAQCIASGYTYGGFRNVNITVEKNTTYTLSVWVYPSANVKEFRIRAYMVSDDDNTLLTNLGTFSDTLGRTGAFRKVTYTFTTTNESSLITLRFYNYFKDTVTTGNADLHLYQPMLSKGDKPKDWVIAQEDIKEDINILSEKISSAELKIEPNAIISTVTSSESWKNQTDDISGLESRVSTAEQKITDKAIVNTVTSSETWKNQANDISGLESRVSTAEQKITDEAITSTVSKGFVSQSSFNSLELGNRNYLLYTNFDKDDAITKWSKWGGCNLDIPNYNGGQLKDIDAHINGKRVLRARTKIESQIANNVQYGGFAPPYITLEKNTTYTFSCWLYQTSTVGEMQVRAYYVNKETNSLGSEIKRVTLPGTWTGSFQKVTLTFTVGTQSDLVSIRFYNYHDTTLTTGNSDMMVYQPMLTKGDKAKDWVEATEEVSLGIIEAQSQITQLADEISFKVSKGDVNSIIRQSPSDIQIGFNGINDRIEINNQYMKFEAENGNRDMLLYGGQVCIYNNTNNTFMSTLGNVLREDTSYKGIGFLAGKNCNAFFIGRDSSWSDILTNRSPNPQGVFFINFANNADGNKGIHIRDNLYTTNNIQAIENSQPTITGFKDIACTNSIFDNWKSVVDQSVVMRYDGGNNNIYLGKNLNGNGFTANNFSTITATQYSVSNSDNIRIARGELYDPKNGSMNRDYVRLAKTYMFGGTGVMYFTNADTADWANIYAGTIYSKQTAITSDMNLKTDIKYVNIDPQTISEDSGLMAPNINITTSDMHEFIETLPMVSYRMKDDVKNGIDDTYYGFLAQEILYTKVGSELVRVEQITDSNGETKESYRYSENKLVSFIAGALQEEIKQRKKLEIELEKLKNEIENLKNK